MAQDLLTVIQIADYGPYLELSDGSSWQVKPGIGYMLVHYWTPGDQIAITGSLDPEYPYQLKNIDSSRREVPLPAKRISEWPETE